MFKTRHCLSQHVATMHFSNLSFKCEVCSASFKCMSYLRQHVLRHNTDLKYKCNECGKLFNVLANLRKHQHEIHKTIRKFKCEKCDLLFNSRSALRGHRLTHATERKFVCSECGAKFFRPSCLCEHQKIHQAGKHKCHVCGSMFVHKITLQLHVRRRHPDAMKGEQTEYSWWEFLDF